MAYNIIDKETVDLLFNDELDSIFASLDIEKEVKTDKKVQCPFCEKVCVSQRGLARHKRCKHPETLPASASERNEQSRMRCPLQPSKNVLTKL